MPVHALTFQLRIQLGDMRTGVGKIGVGDIIPYGRLVHRPGQVEIVHPGVVRADLFRQLQLSGPFIVIQRIHPKVVRHILNIALLDIEKGFPSRPGRIAPIRVLELLAERAPDRPGWRQLDAGYAISVCPPDLGHRLLRPERLVARDGDVQPVMMGLDGRVGQLPGAVGDSRETPGLPSLGQVGEHGRRFRQVRGLGLRRPFCVGQVQRLHRFVRQDALDHDQWILHCIHGDLLHAGRQP